MATQKTVQVTFEPSTGKLGIDSQSPLTLVNPDDWVLWTLSETSPQPPTDSQMFIHFENGLGPFQAVRNVSPHNLVAKGNTGSIGSFSYHLALVFPGLDLVPSAPFTIDNQCSVVNTSPRVTVTYIPQTETPDGQIVPAHLQVDPLQVLLHQGDVALWQVENVPSDHFLAFHIPTGEPATDLFSNVFMTHSPDGTRRLGGAKFNDTATGVIPYRLAVWGPEGGQPLNPDPSIDSLGRPPGT